MVEVELRLPLIRFMSCSLSSSIGNYYMDNLRPGGATRGSVEHSEGKSEESVVAIPGFLCGSLHLCRLRTEGLVPVSKYWTYRSHAGVYGPSKPSSLSSIDACLKSIALLAVLGEKLGRVPWSTQTNWEVELGSLFLRSISIRPTLLITCERLPRMRTVCSKRTLGIRWLEWEAYISCWLGFPLQGVHRFESSRLSYMSNHLFVATIK
jgi:hypothetical protein